MDQISNHEFLANLAHDYYMGKLTITDLSEKYHKSRYLVTKSLDEALESGIVSIQINAPIARNVQLEAALRRRFDIEHVAVIEQTSVSSDDDINNVLEYAAERVQLLIESSHVVGMAWGSTVFSIIKRFQNTLRDDLTFTQYVGENMKYKSESGSKRMVETAAAHYEAKYVTLPAPLYVINNQARNLLKQEPALRSTLTIARRMDLLFCGLGTIESINSIPIWKECRSEIFPNVDASQVVGMLFARPYDINGNWLNSSANDTALGLTIDEVMATPRRVGIIKSKFKTEAALGALRGHLLTDIILNEGIAQRILNADDEYPQI